MDTPLGPLLGPDQLTDQVGQPEQLVAEQHRPHLGAQSRVALQLPDDLGGIHRIPCYPPA